MHPLSIHLKSLLHHCRTHLAVILCAAAGGTALTGALLVGDSMRGSLHDLALKRLGPVDHALTAPRFFRASLAEDIFAEETFRRRFEPAVPMIIHSAAAHHAGSKARVNRINLYGVDDRFWQLHRSPAETAPAEPPRSIALNQSLASTLGARIGDDVLVRLQRQSLIPTESLLGRPDDTTAAIRLTVVRILPDEGPGGFTLQPNQYASRNAFAPLETLQQALGQRNRVNTILVAEKRSDEDDGEVAAWDRLLENRMAAAVRLEDYDLRLRRDAAGGGIALETDRLLLESPIEAAAETVAQELGIPFAKVLTYLANSIIYQEGDTPGSSAAIPYSTVTALDPLAAGAVLAWLGADGQPVPALGRRDILLNQWAAEDLGARIGDEISLEYFVSEPFGGLDTRRTTFTLRGIVPLERWAADPGLTPAYKGITDARKLSDWNPPPSFHFDMRRIREKDEAYWDAHRATPKAFISLADGLELWTQRESRFGRLTSIRFGAAPDHDPASTAVAIETALLQRLSPEQIGLVFRPVKRLALTAGAGSTDFSQLFLAFSVFLIAAAAMLVALIFRLSVERRANEIGILLATGYRPRQVMWMFALEGAILADGGSLLGVFGAFGYAWLMLAGLRSASWWADAVNAPFLELHVSWLSLLIGYAANFLVALLSVIWSIRGLTRMSPRALLAGTLQAGRAPSGDKRGRTARLFFFISAGLGVASLAGAAAFEAVPIVPAFFIGGTALLVAGLSGMAMWIGRGRHRPIRSGGAGATIRLGVRNVTRNRGRSLTTTGLIACAGFVIIAVGASRHGAGKPALDSTGGTGGYALLGEAVIPVQFDLNHIEGREALNLSEEAAGLLSNAEVMSLRLQAGDDTSCLNLYKVTRPSILGAPAAMIDRGGFPFSRSMARTDEQRANPWSLLNRTFDDGAIPTIGDANALTWLLKLGIGDDFIIRDERGRPRRLRIVGMLSGTVLQGQLIVAEHRFKALFPSVSGYAFMLIDSDDASMESLAQTLERDLSDFGLDVEKTLDRLDAYRAVENTYMSTFQALGGLGLVLGTLGLAAVMLRNVLERRGELALLRALGHRASRLGWMVFVENAVLLASGLAIGGVSALLAVAPNAVSRSGQVPWSSLGLTLLLAIVVGMTAGAAAVRSTLRTPLLPALRSE